jgi:hypothetical protein
MPKAIKSITFLSKDSTRTVIITNVQYLYIFKDKIKKEYLTADI